VTDEDVDNVEVSPRVGKMVLKVVTEGEGQPKILIGHSSDGDYNSMLKVVKTYRFNYHHRSELSRIVTNTDITFTSYPASLASSDDFYLAMGKKSRVIIAGVAMKHNNPELLHGIDLVGTIFSSARVMAANRLCHNGTGWSRIMERDPHLGAKQWLVIDERRMKYLSAENEAVTSAAPPNDELSQKGNEIPTDLASADLVKLHSNRNLIWLIDQTYRRLHAEDVTTRFRKDGDAWFLDGTPYFQVIQDLNKLKSKDIKVDQELQNLDDVMNLLKANSHRGDLVRRPTSFGNIDLKLYASEDHELLVQNGPISTNKSQPFDWSSSRFADVRHDEHPTLWNFQPVQVQFLWN
jgi:Phospholipase B